MSNHAEWGHVRTALYTLHPRDCAAEELGAADPDEITAAHVLGIWNENGDGLALQGDREELLNFATMLLAYITASAHSPGGVFRAPGVRAGRGCPPAAGIGSGAHSPLTVQLAAPVRPTGTPSPSTPTAGAGGRVTFAALRQLAEALRAGSPGPQIRLCPPRTLRG